MVYEANYQNYNTVEIKVINADNDDIAIKEALFYEGKLNKNLTWLTEIDEECNIIRIINW